jgi:hypothetical protein
MTDVGQVYDLVERVQVFVTGADGEQMVLSGPEAAALLAQAGISLGDNDQVFRHILSLKCFSCTVPLTSTWYCESEDGSRRIQNI